MEIFKIGFLYVKSFYTYPICLEIVYHNTNVNFLRLPLMFNAVICQTIDYRLLDYNERFSSLHPCVWITWKRHVV